MSKKLPILLPIVAALTLAACQGGGGGGRDSSSTTPGRAVDGYLSGSTVFCDANKNNVLDAGEASGTTDASGNFSLEGSCGGVIVVSGGTDTATGYAFKGFLKSPGGSAYVTPLTTLLADTGLTEAQLNTALGLPANTSLSTIDPMGAGNETVLQRTLAVQQLVQQVANTLGAASTPNAVTSIYTKVAVALAQAIRESSSTPLFGAGGAVNASLVAAAVQTAITSVNADTSLPDVILDASDVTAIANGVSSQAEQFLKALPAALVDLAKTLQSPLNPPVDTPTAQTNYIYPVGDSFMLNGVSKSLTAFASSGVSTTGLNSIGLAYGVAGDVAIDKLVDVAMSLESTTDQRILQVKTEQVRVKLAKIGSASTVTLEVVPETQVHIYARDNRGIAFNTSLSGLSFSPLTVTDDALTVNYATLVDRIVNSAQNNSSFTASQFQNIKGTFDVKFAVSTNLNVRYQNGDRLPMVNAGIYNTTKGVEGPGIVGKLTVN